MLEKKTTAGGLAGAAKGAVDGRIALDIGALKPSSGIKGSPTTPATTPIVNVVLDDKSSEFQALEDGAPLLLLPVRLETRFATTKTAKQLKIRIFPDVIAADDHQEHLTDDERKRGAAFWKEYNAPGASDTTKRTLWARLCQTVDPLRAAWVARQTGPEAARTKIGTRPRTIDRNRPTKLVLPDRWMAIGLRGDVVVLCQPGKTIDKAIQMSPELGTTAESTSSASGPNVGKQMQWMIDYDVAVTAGMAITVPLTGATLPLAQRSTWDLGLDHLIVVGVKGGGSTLGAEALSELLLSHQYTRGASFAPLGTPTNNTELAPSGHARREIDVDALWRREIAPSLGGTARGATLPGAPRGFRAGASTTAARAAWALGMSSDRLTRFEHADDAREESAQQAMNRALWGVTWQRYLSTMLHRTGQQVVDATHLPALKDFFCRFVRGGAFLPTLKIGAQPYGVLPTMLSAKRATPTTTLEHMENVLHSLRDYWRASLAEVPQLSADAGSGSLDGQSNLVAALSSQPHPEQFVVRTLKDTIPFLGSIEDAFDFVYELMAWEGSRIKPAAELLWTARYTSGSDVRNQLGAYRSAAAGINGVITDADDRETAHWLMAQLIREIEKRLGTSQPLIDLDIPSARFATAISEAADVPFVLRSFLGDSHATVARPLAGDGSYLSALRQAPTAAPTTAPILHQLLADASCDRTELAALEGLSEETLELRMKETLGLCTHRLDAWFTALASARLDALRAKKATGVHLGGFGIVHDLRRVEPSEKRDGYIHASTLGQAAAAAVLRSGFEAHQSETSDSPLAVDLSSERVRLAEWLLSGVREGQSLADLLGYRFERRLHDDELSGYIEDVRRAVLTFQGEATVGAPSHSVDGVALMDAHRANALSTVLTTAAAHAPPEDARLRDAFASVFDAMDAIADCATFESVFQMMHGKSERAAAVLDAITDGSVPPPELEAQKTPVRGAGIAHRVMALFPVVATTARRGWTETPRARLSPRLEHWAASVLGKADDIVFRYRLSADAAAPWLDGHAGELGIAALDFVCEAPAGDGLAGICAMRVRSALARRNATAANAASDVVIDADHRPARANTVSLADGLHLARTLRDAVLAARPLDARDVQEPTGADSLGLDIADLDARLAQLRTDLATARAALELALDQGDDDGASPDATTRRASLLLALEQLACALPFSAVADASLARVDLRSHARAMQKRAVALEAAIGDDIAVWATRSVDDATRVERAAAVVERVLGARSLLLPTFAPNNLALLRAAFAKTDALLGKDRSTPFGWLQQMGMVRPKAGTLEELASLSEALAQRGTLTCAIAQLPTVATDTEWVAIARPSDEARGRVHILAVADGTSVKALSLSATFQGLMFDEWNEIVPSGDVVTGLAVHHSAPSAKPPQATLLMVPPASDPWSLDLIVLTIMQTFEAAALRMVAPETLTDLGHHLPAVFAPQLYTTSVTSVPS